MKLDALKRRPGTRHYPAKIEAAGQGFMMSFQDIREALTRAGAQTRVMAADAPLMTTDAYREDAPADRSAVHCIDVSGRLHSQQAISIAWGIAHGLQS